MIPTSVRNIFLAAAVLLMAVVMMTSSFPLEIPVVRRAYLDNPAPNYKPGACWDREQYVKCYACAKHLGSDLVIYERCCRKDEEQNTEIDIYCSVITGIGK